MPADATGRIRGETVPMGAPVIGECEIAAAVRVLRSGQVGQGPEVEAFEAEFSELVEGRHCVAVNSGTTAVYLALLALGIGPGDEVIVASFSNVSTVRALCLVGAVPVFADIEPASFCLDPAAVAAAVGPRTAAIAPAHLYGHPAAMDQLVPLARRHGLAIVEDATPAHSAAVGARPVGTFGVAGCFTFYPGRNTHTLEGGLVCTADPALARTVRRLRNQGVEQRRGYEVIGANLRMTDVSAAIGRAQLSQWDSWTVRRHVNAKHLDAAVAAPLVAPSIADHAVHAYDQYTIRVPQRRTAVRQRLRRLGIDTAIYYPTPVHRLAAYRDFRAPPLPETDRAASEVLSLPVHPALTPAQLARVCTAIGSPA